MRELFASWGVAFARDGDEVRVTVDRAPEFRKPLVWSADEPEPVEVAERIAEYAEIQPEDMAETAP
jgi:hypothetical protein